MKDASDDASPKKHWVKEGIVGATLCACLGFVIILLVHEGNGHKARKSFELWVVCWYRFVLVLGGENDISDGEKFGLSPGGDRHVLTAATTEKVGAASEIGGASFE